jgi:hypothetical protein
MSLKFLTAKALATGAALAISAGGAAVAANVVLPATAPVVFGAVAAPGNAALVGLTPSGESVASAPAPQVVVPEVQAPPPPEVVETGRGERSNLGGADAVDQVVVEPPTSTIAPIVTPTTRAPRVESEHERDDEREHEYEEEGDDD